MLEKEIREKLKNTLANDSNNYSKILELSSKLASFDKENIRFSVDAGIIDRLGTELVARQETAVSELVKNSYDADAKKVSLIFENSNSIGGTLFIEDDGLGMTREQLINGFMRISSTDKLRNPISERFNRNRAGQKGIGRFAVQRLGEKLTITTQTINDDFALVLTIDWEKYQGDKDLSNITNKIITVPKRKDEGTTLRIEGLKDKWTQAAIKRIYRYVSAIIQPFPLSETENIIDNTIKKIDPGFKTIFKKIENDKIITIADEASMIYNHAVAEIEGWIDKNGLGIYSVNSKQLKIEEYGEIGSDPDDMTIPFSKLKKVKFKAFYYIYNKSLIPKMHETSIKNLSKISGGIRLYRNGFRVLPYGEPKDDWLKLDASANQRSFLPVHSNNNFFGFVELTDTEKVFNETSSREGLIENEALVQLQNFVYRTIISGVVKVAEIRNVKIVSGQKKEGKIWEKIEVRIKDIAHTIEALDLELEKEEGNIQVKLRRKKTLQKLQKDIQKVVELQKEETTKVLKERSMLRVLSSVGITIGQFIHEVRDYLINMQSDVNFLLEKLSSDTVLLERVVILEQNIATFRSYTSYFDNIISQNVVRELKPIEIQNITEKFWTSIHNDALKSNIKFDEPVRNGFYLYTLPMHPSEWSSILFNFYTNAKKAIKRTKSLGEIKIECGETEKIIYLEFSDTGDGISEENEEKIFDEFFTTTSQKALDVIDESNEITGTGLGLKIVKDIVSSYRGNIQVVSPKRGFSTCLRIEIPKATEKELDNHDI
ncbi:GHKL domain-containing protein [Tenacibaculum finnmarkense genomovar ulcerans]|uniref:sensor histidine kinase n=1 Tax=Tenacibaculum finnmarkense TaxID=2781243 RepID=UPI00187B7DD5|nr:ATP-binding protein [Tenacibaculum finnmarkense]MBE7644468.1 GHKL domain-containing protein [Tenacibaculum finnmarkense genomovar ulcerans]MBE7648060.1 GHKL domain-containing protein [Tenacibaculum finnmarkense genomovar ulcerans]WCC41759.1 ATP-binding protein [Tenacibaculum finnmarkense]